jgi:BolA protein
VTAERVAEIRARIEAALAPQELDVLDEGHLHIGHEGARDGRGHFRVRIVSEKFAGLGPRARHRLVYDAVGSLMQTDIHALAITALTAAEARARPGG